MGRRTKKNKEKKSRFRFVIFLAVISMIAVFVGFQLGNTFFARQAGETEEEVYEVAQEEIAEEETLPDADTVPEEVPPEGEDVIADPQQEDTTEDMVEDITEESLEVETEEDLPAEEEIEVAGYYVQVGSFSDYDNAQNFSESITAEGFTVEVAETEPHRVLVQGGESREEAEEVASELQDLGHETFIISQEN